MNILIVCSTVKGNLSTFIEEQIKALQSKGVVCDFFKIEGRGIYGYLKELLPLRKKIMEGKYDLVHAHYGLSGLLANFQRLIPVVTTFHGSDINRKVNNLLSTLTGQISAHNIYVSKKLFEKLYRKPSNYSIIPCGIDLEIMRSIPKERARAELKMGIDKNFALFSSSFERPEKNSKLAKEAIKLAGKNIELIELKGYSRHQVKLLMNACNLLLMTSFTEGSPQVIKEAMACGTPIISTDVGDVREVIGRTKNCFITCYDKEGIANKITYLVEHDTKTDGRKEIKKFDKYVIVEQIINIYTQILGKNNI